MPNFDHNSRFDTGNCQVDPLEGSFAKDEDVLMEQILKSMNSTPLGKVLKKIASLPEVRQEKILDVRRQLTEGRYDLNRRLDNVLERVLEDLIA